MIIRLRDIQCYGYHGVLESEKQKGNTFRVDVCAVVDNPAGLQTDDIQDTLDYRVMCAIVAEEMSKPSDLLENVAWRIKQSLFNAFPNAKEFTVTVAKKTPPLDLPVAWAEVEI